MTVNNPAPASYAPRPKSNKRRCYILLALFALAIIIALIVPLAVLLPRRCPKGKKSTILFPLYIYPDPGAYDPLYQQITAHPALNFTIIINPDSGPGNTTVGSLPDSNFTTAIQQLNSYPNVRTVGYVHVSYGQRNISDVIDDVDVYASWGLNSSTLAMDGIFFDEAPSTYDEATGEYMESVNQVAKNASGIVGEKLVIHNPGTIPDSRLVSNSTDVTVVFEGPYSDFEAQQSAMKTLSLDRSKYSYIMYAVPSNMSTGNLKKFVNGISQRSEYLFLTDLTDDYYESFGVEWGTFVGVVPT